MWTTTSEERNEHTYYYLFQFTLYSFCYKQQQSIQPQDQQHLQANYNNVQMVAIFQFLMLWIRQNPTCWWSKEEMNYKEYTDPPKEPKQKKNQRMSAAFTDERLCRSSSSLIEFYSGLDWASAYWACLKILSAFATCLKQQKGKLK